MGRDVSKNPDFSEFISFATLDFISAVQYMIHFVYIISFVDSFIKGAFSAISAFIAQLVRASHRHREVTGSNPVEVLNFSGFSTQLLKLLNLRS